MPASPAPDQRSLDQSSLDQRFRGITIAALIFVLCCLLSSAREVWDGHRSLKDSANDIAQRSDQRFAAIKASLPGHGVIGYIGEPGATMGDYYSAQYALAPLVVDHSPNHPIVVGNFPSSPSASSSSSSLPGSENLQLVKDYGDGVLLFANRGTQNKGDN
jgi:hypothetical protein